MNKLVSVLKLTRIEHSIMLIIAVVAAELVARGLPGSGILLLSLVTPVFISMGAFAINDYFDIEVDRKNGKKRPLVTRELDPAHALWITGICMAIGIIASFFINMYCAEIAIIFGALSLLYSYKLKDLPLIGNAYVAFSMSIPFIFGSYVVTPAIGSAVLIIFAMVFMSGLAREIDGAVRDYKGDMKRNAMTLPRAIGIPASAFIALLLYMAAIVTSVYLFTFVPPFMGNLLYAFMISISDVMLFYSGLVFAFIRSRRYDKVRNISLGGMALALLAILLATLVHVHI